MMALARCSPQNLNLFGGVTKKNPSTLLNWAEQSFRLHER